MKIFLPEFWFISISPFIRFFATKLMTVFYFDVLIIAVDVVVNNAGIVVSSTTSESTLSTKLSTLSLMTLFVKLLPLEANLNFTLLVVCTNTKDLQSQLMGAKHSFL